MSELPRIAVVTPSYNTARFIGAAIRSVLDQSYKNFDYLVMDGGSPDGTLDVLRSFGDRIRWISERDRGQADAIRRGFARTTGDILAWLNSDDMFAPGAFETIAKFFAAHREIDVVYGDATYVDRIGRHIARCAHVERFSKRRLFYYSDFIVQPATFFRRSAYEAAGGIDTRWHWSMDYDLWLKMAGAHRFAHLPKELAHYRWLADNKTASGGFERIDEIRSMVRCHGYNSPAYIELERVNLCAGEVLRSLRKGKVGRATSAAIRAAGTLLASPRAVWSLLSPHTWRIAWVGQVLRRRSLIAATDESWEGAPCPNQS